MVSEDCDLVDRCLTGRESAFYEFVERFQTLVFGVCLRMLGDRQEAEDAAQEVFVRALRGLSGWDRSRPLRPWLLTIAANRCRTFLARKRSRPTLCEYVEEAPDHRPEEGDAAELHAEIRQAVSGLRDDYQQVFLLYHEQGLSYDEMRELTGKPIGTLKTWLHRARNEVLDYLRNKGLVPEWKHDLSGV